MKQLTLVLLIFGVTLIYAQQTSSAKATAKFDPKANPVLDLKKAVTAAKKENKRIILDVGGEWCIWCHRIDQFIEENTDIYKFMHNNFVVLKINYSEENKNEKFLAPYPKVKGFPHFFVLEKNGKLLYSQDTGLLEKGKSYDNEKMMDFLKKWAPKQKGLKKKV
jgi:thioredoxin-related protein